MMTEPTTRLPRENHRQATEIDQLVGARLKMQRKLAGLSQDGLASMLGLTFQQLQKYEKGVNRIGASRLFDIAQKLNVPVQFFFDDAGVNEAKAGASTDTASQTTADFLSMVSSSDGAKMVRAFQNISDPRRRRALVELAQSMAGQTD
jgi:transcriptional regulator with XRE-family HTH domain